MKKIFSLIFFALSVSALLFFYKSPHKKLRKVPFSDKNQIVLEVLDLDLINVKNPINSSIESFGNDFLLTYRINEKDASYIGLSILDKNLKEKDFKKIDVNSKSAEDPRIFKFKNDYFLIFNDKLDIKHNCRVMFIAKLNKKFEIEYKTPLYLHIKPVEKNWTPFTYKNRLHLSYGLMPHKVMELENLEKNSLKHLVFEKNPCYSRFFWKWGSPRGGTPAKLVDGEFLSFFHSSFGKNKNKKIYVMGAYMYQKDPPFKVTKVSMYPIIFGKKKRVYFPAGFIIKKVNGKDLIYLTYGENDNNSKIVILDKDKLFENMKKVY